METRETIGEIMITQEEILKRAKEIGEQITKDHKDKEVVIVGILKGATLWMSDVIKNVDLDIIIDFMAVSSYGKEKHTSGIVNIIKDIDVNVEGKTVIIVEDIVDSGNTLTYLREYFYAKKAIEVEICTLLDKPTGRQVEIEADYIGFTVEDKFIVGYGLDFDQRYRQLPYISFLQD